MGAFSRIIGGFRGLFQQNRSEQDLDDELREYLETAVERKMSGGMSRDAAVRAARVEVGSVEAVKDRVRDVGWESVVESVWQDVRFAVRMLRKQPALAAAAVTTLGLGLGGTTAIFSVVDALFLRAPAGVVDAASVRRLYVKRDAGRFRTPSGGAGSWADYSAMRNSGPALAGVSAYLYPELVDLGRGSVAEQVRASVVSHDFLSVLGVRAALGRLFVADDDGVPGAHPVAVISHAMWQSRFGGAADTVGKTLLVNGVLLEIVGVTAKSFAGIEADAVDVWLTSSMAGPLRLTNPEGDWRTVKGIYVRYVARLAPGAEDAAAVAQAAAGLQRAADEELDPSPEVLTSPVVLAAMPGGTRAANLSLWLALVAALVLIIACANVANLLLARAITRRRELAIRLSLGAGAWRVARQHLTESAVLALVGGVAGVVIASLSMGAMGPMRQFPLPPSAGQIDARLFAFALGLSLLTGLLFGILPAIRAVQVDPVQALRESRAAGTLTRSHARRVLIVLQIALSLALTVGAGLFVRSLRNVHAVRGGVDVERVLVARVDLRRAHYTPETRESFYDEGLARLSNLPGVERAAIAHLEPFHGGMPPAFWARPGETTIQQTFTVLTVVSPGYFEAAGTRLQRGRTFEASDRPGAEPVAVVDDTMARRLAPDGNVVGLCVPFNRQIRRGGCTRIVGVVERQRRTYLDDEFQPRVFLVRAQFPDAIPFGTPSFIVRTSSPARDAAAVRATLQSLRSDTPFVAVEPLSESIRGEVLPFRLGATLFSLFGALALILAAVGLYGVLGYFVTERAPEIGIRRSLGAPVGSVVRLVVRQGMVPVGVGLVLGLAAAFAGTRYLASLLFGVEARDPVSFAGAAGFLVCVALLATFLPAWRAARIDPMVTLRQD
jgi:putative ABC transport system permease protein